MDIRHTNFMTLLRSISCALRRFSPSVCGLMGYIPATDKVVGMAIWGRNSPPESFCNECTIATISLVL